MGGSGGSAKYATRTYSQRMSHFATHLPTEVFSDDSVFKCYAASFFILKLMNIVLNEIEARVLGALVEKDITTPDYYPLSLNALVNACNQRNNRDPVMNLEEGAVRDALMGCTTRAGRSGQRSRQPRNQVRTPPAGDASTSRVARPLFCACCCCAGLRRRESCAGGQSACTALKIWMRCNPVCRN